MMSSYSALQEPIFVAFGFVASEVYEDGLGALVVDFLRADDRVTLAVDETQAQILYLIAGEFNAVEFGDQSESLIAVLDFVQSQFV